METDRRTFVGAAAMLAAMPGTAVAAGRETKGGSFPKEFLWGAATAGHQIEGNNTNSDSWVLENVKPTIYREPSMDAANSIELWPVDLDLVKSLGLNSYRFSLEWARIEPEPGRFSVAMLNHYKAVIEGCRARGLTPIVTYNHFTVPKWFAAQGGWTNPKSPELFARFCERATKHLGAQIGYALTMNETNLQLMLWATLPALMSRLKPVLGPTSAAAAKAVGSDRFEAANLMLPETAKATLPNIIAGHKAGRAAIKSVRPDLPVGVTLAIADEQVGNSPGRRDQVRADAYGAWLEAVKGDDFLGVQNYARNVWDENGARSAPAGAKLNYVGAEVYAPSLAGAVRYAHEATGCPIMVTEHGVGTNDDTIRAGLIPAALKELKVAMDAGVPVLGYQHWSLIDNYEWLFGYGPKFGLCSLDRETFKRTPKPSAFVLGSIAKRNAV
jgi:beta-glucosidase